MSKSINSISPHPIVTSVAECELKVEVPAQQSRLTGAELDELMDNHFRHMFDVFQDGIFYMSSTEHVCFYNPSFYERFGIDSGDSCLQAWLDIVHPLDKHAFNERVDEHIQEDGVTATVQYRAKTTEGRYIWLEGTAITKTVNGHRFMIGCHKDVSDKKLLESFVQQASFKDEVSGLSNGHKLLMDLDKQSESLDSTHHLIYFQINNLRSYQTMYGSQIMRDLLSNFTCELHELPDAFVDMYRVRTEDFAILVRGEYDAEGLVQLGEKISQLYKQSVRVTGFLYGNDISVGIYPSISPFAKPEEVVEITARTSHYARQHNQNAIASYTGKEKKAVDRHFYIERELGNAITNGILSVKFQPIVCTQQNRVSSFEALVRWRSKEIGEIYPDEFICVAEKKGLISDLGTLVFEKACSFLNQYRLEHGEDIRVNVNVSVLQLLNHRFPEQLQAITNLYDVSPHNIVLELTETIILDDNQHAVDQLNRLRDIGFLLALDDFGAGYSSLNSFFDLPLAQIKIDKSTAWRSFENPATFEYLTFVIQLCKTYAVDIVVEGIESADMQRVFTDMGAAYLQGYWFSKPLSLASASRYTQI